MPRISVYLPEELENQLSYQAKKRRVPASRVVQEALMGINRMPSLFVFPHCERTIYEFGHYIWDDWRRGAAKERTAKQKPRSKDDHMLENLRRLLLLPAEYRQTAQFRGMIDQMNQGYQPMDAVAGY